MICTYDWKKGWMTSFKKKAADAQKGGGSDGAMKEANSCNADVFMRKHTCCKRELAEVIIKSWAFPC
jgi:hypothetical protein